MTYNLPKTFKRTNIILKNDQYEFLREKAYKENTNFSKIIRTLIDELRGVSKRG